MTPEQAGNKDEAAGEAFAKAVAIMAQLRGPEGCAWDREQTPESIRRYTLEETYEVLDAIERGHAADLCEELGDLLLQVLFYAQMSEEAGQFSIVDVVRGLNRKLVRRHPHVFGQAASAAAGNGALLGKATSDIAPDQVTENWNAIKKMERKVNLMDELPISRLEGVLRHQPALLEAHKLGSAAARCGFDWPDPRGLLAKIREEADEVEAEIADGVPASRELQLEVGDLLFVTASLARHLGVDAETALRDANGKFRSRFQAMEGFERQDGGPSLGARSLEELEELWQAAKQQERQAGPA